MTINPDPKLDIPTNSNESFAMPPLVFKPSKAMVVICAYRDEDGAWCSHVPALQGAVGQGDTAEEALHDAKDALYALLESYREDGEPVPWDPKSILCLEHWDDFENTRQATHVVKDWDGKT